MKLFFLFFISFIFNSFCEFVIKWKRSLNNSINDETIFYNLINNILLFDIQVGSKKEKITFQIIFNEYAFALIGSDTETSIKKYNYKESKSYKNISDIKSYYFSFFKECYQATENFIINNKNINNIKFVLTTELDKFFDDFFVSQTGYFGLQITPRSLADDLIDFAIIKQLKANKIISSYTFKIVYDNKNNDLNDIGKIVLGEKDYEKNFQNNNFLTKKAQIFSSHLEWGFSMDNVTYGDIEVKDFNKLVKFCIENAAIIGTEKFHDIIFEEFFNDTINDNLCFKKEIYPFIFYYCNKDVDISNFKDLNFELKDINITFNFNKDDLFYNEGNYKYFLVVFTIHSTNWIFGRPFFKKFGDNYIFDQDKNLMLMYKNVQNNSDEKKSVFVKKFFIVILIIIIIVLVIYIINYLKNNKSRKKAFEIEDNYEYNSQDDYKNTVSKLLMN